MNITLIQLISEQTMQNLLPVVALRPRRLVHLTTSKTAARSAKIVEAAQQAGIQVQLENLRLTEMPSIPETSRATLRALEIANRNRETPLVNFTGGTKLMSIGAYEAALQKKASSFYVDTQTRVLVDGHTGPKLNQFLGDDLSFTPFEEVLTLDVIARANGVERITGGSDWRPYLELANHLLEYPAEESATWEALHGRDGLFPAAREPRRPADWLPLLERPILLPSAVGEMAAAAGIVEQHGPDLYLPSHPAEALRQLTRAERPDLAEYFRAVQPLQFAASFLSGAWWEVIVAQAAKKSGEFRDLRWSTRIDQGGGSFAVEEDLVGVDGVQVAYFSCKRGGARSRLVPLLDELDNRARTLGGNYTRRFLAVYLPPRGNLFQALGKRAYELGGIHILTPPDLEKARCFRPSF